MTHGELERDLRQVLEAHLQLGEKLPADLPTAQQRLAELQPQRDTLAATLGAYRQALRSVIRNM